MTRLTWHRARPLNSQNHLINVLFSVSLSRSASACTRSSRTSSRSLAEAAVAPVDLPGSWLKITS